ncbi:MAG: hypothetical protein EAZ95_15295 [Bacteroidetes bacterium]|nr:MAG: hypothetical protein EAZ95_15295 [Bacteroidota bacterium]
MPKTARKPYIVLLSLCRLCVHTWRNDSNTTKYVNNMNLSFFLHVTPTKQDKQGFYPIKAQLDVNGKRLQFTLPKLRTSPAFWCNVRQRALTCALDYELINTMIERVQARFTETHLQYEREKRAISPKEMQKVLLMQETPRMGLREMINRFIEHYKGLVNVGVYEKDADSHYAYKARRYWLPYFCEKEGVHEPSQITRAMQNGLYLFVLENKPANSVRNPHNNAVYVLRTFRTFLNFAIECEWVDKNVFAKIKYKTEDTEIVSLDSSEVEAIRLADSAVLRHKGMQHTRDAFLVSCATGLAWSDLCQIDKEKIVHTLSRLSLRIKRKKTKVMGVIPLFKEAREILERYDFDLKMPAYNTYNDRVKRLCAWVGIKKKVATHTGRKTFANYMLNVRGVPLETVANMMLHADWQTTARYYVRVNDEKVLKDTAHIE